MLIKFLKNIVQFSLFFASSIFIISTGLVSLSLMTYALGQVVDVKVAALYVIRLFYSLSPYILSFYIRTQKFYRYLGTFAFIGLVLSFSEAILNYAPNIPCVLNLLIKLMPIVIAFYKWPKD